MALFEATIRRSIVSWFFYPDFRLFLEHISPRVEDDSREWCLPDSPGVRGAFAPAPDEIEPLWDLVFPGTLAFHAFMAWFLIIMVGTDRTWENRKGEIHEI